MSNNELVATRFSSMTVWSFSTAATNLPKGPVSGLPLAPRPFGKIPWV
jgi:hypothetical protein